MDRAAGARRGVGGARRGAKRRGPRAALCRDRDAARRLGAADGGAGDRARSARSQGTRNLVAFTTRRYRTEPLVISGPGAGAEVTAAGILNDIYSLAGALMDATHET